MSMYETATFLETMEKIRDKCHQNSVNKGFWDEKIDKLRNESGVYLDVARKPWNFGEKLMLIVSEIGEMFEAWRQNKVECDKPIDLPDETVTLATGETGKRRMTAVEEEMADVFIRLFDLCGKLDLDVGRIILAKMAYNETRSHMHGGRRC